MGRIIRNQQWVREQIEVSSIMKKGKACSVIYCWRSNKEDRRVDQSCGSWKASLEYYFLKVLPLQIGEYTQNSGETEKDFGKHNLHGMVKRNLPI